MAQLIFLNSAESLRDNPEKCYGMTYFINYFQSGIIEYIKKLTVHTVPKQIIVSCIYFPDENEEVPSWASTTLKLINYNKGNSEKLQNGIRAIFNYAISQIKIENVTITPVALYLALDGKNSSDYVERVEPSVSGSEKIVNLIVTKI